jgi:hypothetical protein
MVSRLRLNPDVAVRCEKSSELVLAINPIVETSEPSTAMGACQYRLTNFGEARFVLERGWYCPNFGDRLEVEVITSRSQFRDRRWIAWILQPIEQNYAVEARFHDENLEVRLPNESVVRFPCSARQ